MKLTDQFAIDTTERLERQRRRPPVDADDEEEETLTYKERPPMEFLNRAPDVFETRYRKGINTEESVFGRTAVFKTE